MSHNDPEAECDLCGKDEFMRYEYGKLVSPENWVDVDGLDVCNTCSKIIRAFVQQKL